MAKEGLFNILNNRYYFEDIKVLDLFAGTGNISFEFASRGVDNITAIDNHMGCIQYISKTAEALEVAIDTYKFDVFKFLEKTQEKFDIIFADPPYEITVDALEQLVALVMDKQLLKEDGVLIIEHSSQNSLDHLSAFAEKRKYGGCIFSFFST